MIHQHILYMLEYLLFKQTMLAHLDKTSLAICTQRKNFFRYRVVKFWNSLPREITQSKSVNQFKNLENFHCKEKPTEEQALRLGKIIKRINLS